MHWIWRSFIFTSISGFGIFLFIFYSETGELPDFNVHADKLAVWLLLINAAGLGMYFLNRSFNKVFPWKKSITARFSLEVTSGMIIVVLAATVFAMLYRNNILLEHGETTLWQEYWDEGVKFGVLSLVIIYIYSLINFSMYSYNQYTQFQIDNLKDERNRIYLQFEALKNQLSPHYLFNALNTISSLIYKNTQIAEDFIRRMAHTYKYILQTHDTPLTDIRTELDMVYSYFFMQKIKYDEYVDLSVDLTEELMNSYVPPLTFQMLIENALKHNFISEECKLNIEIKSEHDKYLLVSNNIIPKSELLKIGNNLLDRPVENKSHKIGLNNIRKRYSHFTDKKVHVDMDKHFTVKLPVILEPIENKTFL